MGAKSITKKIPTEQNKPPFLATRQNGKSGKTNSLILRQTKNAKIPQKLVDLNGHFCYTENRLQTKADRQIKGMENMANFYKKAQISNGRAQQKKAQSGRSMVEMLGVLAIIGVLSVGGIAGYSKAMSKWKINKAIDQISMIIANVQTLFSNTNDYSALRTKAYSLGIFPSDMNKESENYASNVFGLSAELEGYDNWWYLDYFFYGREACMALLTQDWKCDYVNIGGNDDFRFTKFPISISEAGEACQKIDEIYNYETDNVYIELGFK